MARIIISISSAVACMRPSMSIGLSTILESNMFPFELHSLTATWNCVNANAASCLLSAEVY